MRFTPACFILALSLAVAAAPRLAFAAAGTVPDGLGGCFVAWDERRNESEVASTSEVLVQHFTSTGTVAAGWPAYGLHVTDSPPNQDSPSIVSDGAGGAIVVWMDYTGGGRMPRAQHLSGSGQHLWSSVGMALSEGDSLRFSVVATSDGAGGAFVSWLDSPFLAPRTYGIVVQHLESSGLITSGWPAPGLLIKQDASVRGGPTLFADGTGGAIVVWQEVTLFAQRLTASGVRLWSPPTGIDLGLSSSALLAGDGAGGLLAASGVYGYDVFAHRFDGGGAPAWGASGVLVHTSLTQIGFATLAPDSSGGTIVGWTDNSGAFAQRLDATGAIATGWPADGAQISDAGGPSVVAPDGTGGAFFAWSKFSAPNSFDVRSQHLANDGTPAWPLSGAAVASGTLPGALVTAIADGTGGEIVCWRHATSGLLGHDLAAQRLDAAGAVQWGSNGLAVSSEAFCQRAPALVGDGTGGALAFWMDKRSGGWDIFGKRVNSAGSPFGASAAVCTATDDQTYVQAVDDGAGGACVAWRDMRNGVQGVEAQRLTSGGVLAWTADGVDLVEGNGNLFPFGLASDGAGGAIMSSQQFSYPYGVSAQRLDAGGTPLWGSVGVSVVDDASFIFQPIDAVADGAGGAILVWWGNGFDPDSAQNASGYHAQRLNSAGTRLWGNSGVTIARSLSSNARQRVTGDGAGGVYLAWLDGELGDGAAVIRVQHRDGAGHLAAGWPEHGVIIASLPTPKRLSAIAPDGAGGVAVGWCDLRGGSQWRAYVQRVASDGTVDWLAQGVQLTANAGDQLLSGLVPDGSGGTIALWMDGSGTTWDLRSQRVNGIGVTQWSAAGLAVCTAAGNQYAPAIVPDGAGGALAAWQDDRAFPIDEVYMARFDSSGTLLWPGDGVVPVLASLVSAAVKDGVAHLEWHVATATSVNLERSDDGAAWSLRATLDADGQGRVRFEDADVRPAHRYGWRLVLATAGGLQRTGETWLEILSGESFALHGAYPNPSRRVSTLAFSLPVAAPARLEIIDISGRRVWSRDVGALGAGRHVVSPPELRAGVYLARLTQGPRSATARFERVK